MWFSGRSGQNQFGVYRALEQYLKDFRDQDIPRTPVLYLYNFRSFRGFHAIELGQLTFLYGGNSTGKSTIHKALEEAVNVLTKKTSISKSARENKTNGTPKSEPYGIGFGGVHAGNIGCAGPTGVDAYRDHEWEVDDLVSSFSDKLSGDRHNAFWDVFLLQDQAEKLPGRGMSYWVWRKEELLASYSSNLQEFNLYEFNNDVSGGLIDDFLENCEKADEILGRYIPSASRRVDSLYTWNVFDDEGASFHDFRFKEKVNKQFFSIADLCRNAAKRHWFRGVEIPVEGAKSVVTNNWEDMECLNIWDINPGHYGRDYIHPTRNFIAQFLIWFTNELPETMSWDFQHHKVPAIRPVPSKYDMTFKYKSGTQTPSLDYNKNIWENLARVFLGQQEVPGYETSLLDNRSQSLKEINKFLSSKQWLNSSLKLCGEITEIWHKTNHGEYASDSPDEVEVKIKLLDKKMEVDFSEVGTGFSQVLPVIYAITASYKVFISQPELHLHPKLAYRLGKVAVMNALKKDHYWHIFETHSEDFLKPALESIKGKKLDPNKLRVYVLTKDSKGTVLTRIRIDEDGDFIDAWPGGYFDETVY